MNKNDSQQAEHFFLSEEEWKIRHKEREERDKKEFAELGEKYLGKPLRELNEALTKLNNLN